MMDEDDPKKPSDSSPPNKRRRSLRSQTRADQAQAQTASSQGGVDAPGPSAAEEASEPKAPAGDEVPLENPAPPAVPAPVVPAPAVPDLPGVPNQGINDRLVILKGLLNNPRPPQD